MDFAERGTALRHCDGKRAAVESDGFGELAVEGEKGADPRRRSIETADFDAVFCSAQGREQVPGVV